MATEELRSADERILAALREEGPDYLPLVANRLGLPPGYAQRRVAVLADRGLIEPVTGGAIYRVTDRGRRYLSEDATGDPRGGGRNADD